MAKQAVTFAEQLRVLRENAGITKYALAKRAGLTKQAVTRLEAGQNLPNWETVQRLAQALGATCQDFTDPGLMIPSAEESAPGKPGRPPKAKPAPPPAAALEAEGKQRHAAKGTGAAKPPRARKGK
jgi:DNA-binding XRE family transcriptional regulator